MILAASRGEELSVQGKNPPHPDFITLPLFSSVSETVAKKGYF